MTQFWLKFVLKSDATFGRGDGVAGLLDREVQHDAYGLPYLGGRALKGLLFEESVNILFALRCQGGTKRWERTEKRLFGVPGSQDEDQALLRIGEAHLPDDLRQAVRIGFERNELNRGQVLNSLTSVRRQTAIEVDGIPKAESLRSMRVILRETPFEAALEFRAEPSQEDLALLAACIKALRRAGTGRNRGRGELEAWLLDAQRSDITQNCFRLFEKEMLKVASL